MKRNCIIADTEELARIVACMDVDCIAYKSDSCYLSADGLFHFVMKDWDTGLFSIKKTFTPREIAEHLGCLNWEVVSVPDGDSESLALLFYA